ncbi:MAG: hypothetical protein K2N10_08810, partial [Muribaculaceae bacterium]|nr:hypothetical protein [Muribaculaceae bacterium]
MYFQTGAAGQTNPWDANRTSAACLIYEATEMTTEPIEVTFNYPAFGGVQPNAATVPLLPGTLDVNNIPAVEHLTITGVAESNKTISSTNKTFNVTGTWNFPFALDRVYRANIRSAATRWTVLDDGQINTKSADATQFAPANLFYLKGHGYDADNRLKVSLHSVGYNDEAGVNCASTNNSLATLVSLEPTQWIVKLNSNATEASNGISLQHPDGATTHANDVNNKLGVWVSTLSQNDGGSFIRFFDLTDEDFATTSYTHNGTAYPIDAAAMAAAQANPTGANVRALFPAEAIKQVRRVDITMTYQGHTMLSGYFIGVVGQEYTFSGPDFFADQVTVTVPETGAINYELQQFALPFKYTATTDNMIWQAVQLHTNRSQRFTWTFTEAESNTIVSNEPADLATNGFADTQLWAFVGNYFDGFKIYNKAAGLDMWLYEEGNTNNDHIKVGTSTTGCIWKPYGSSTNPDNSTYCCFRTSANGRYLNVNSGLDNGTTLTHWGSADEGSTCGFTAAADPMLPTAKAFVTGYNGPANVVGAVDFNGVDFSNTADIIAAAEADKYDLAAAEELRNLIATYNSNVTVKELTPNAYYRIVSSSDYNAQTEEGRYLYTGATDLNVYGGTLESKNLNYHSLFSFEPKEGATNCYYIHSQGLYLGHAEESQNVVQVEADGDRGEYAIEATRNHGSDYTAIFSFNDLASSTTETVRHYLFNNDDAAETTVSGWGPWVHQSDFYIVPAENIEMDLDMEFKGMHIGFGYFPFAVSATDDQTHFYAIHEGFDKETNAPVITYSEIDDFVPANTGFMVSHNKSAKATLNICEPAATTRNSVRRHV